MKRIVHCSRDCAPWWLIACVAAVIAVITGGCAVLAGGAAGAATGYIAGSEAKK
ncbi:MAG TPA: hypothetical protein VHC70_00115 [Phycisphaerales bacterium]|jgi:hypothetical protein|nr:hypothetical protein [Phycisphaerales bacterium]